MSNHYLPDYTSLWSSTPTPAYLIDTSRNSHTSSNTSTTNNVQTNTSNPNTNATQNHATSQSHLAILQKNSQSRAVYHHAKGDHLPSRGGRSKWKKGLKFFEKQRGYTFNGCALTEAEEKELSDEEDARAGWRDHILSYGQTNIVILGKGKTAREEEQDLADRGGNVHNYSSRSGNVPGRAGTATNSNANANAAQQPQSQQEQNSAANGDNAEDDDVFQGEYTLDHGSSEDDGEGDGGLDGGDVDLDAGLQSMD